MKKINMWYIKLAFAALFFTYIAEAMSFTPVLNKVSAPMITTVEAASTIDVPDTLVQRNPLRLAAPTKRIAVKGKAYTYNLVIPALKINVGVRSMGVTPEGRMAVPDNYTEVGWYSLGYRPGEMGSAVLGAHVDNGGNVKGVFKNLKKLKVGESIYIGDGDGNVYHYKVTERKIYNYRTAITDEVFNKIDAERINLITCHGTWLPKENTYNQRLVVSAELVTTTKLTQR
jgi:LPXTG-site transpeptidase (sortase) family protein